VPDVSNKVRSLELRAAKGDEDALRQVRLLDDLVGEVVGPKIA
jgi:hypothetical protein